MEMHGTGISFLIDDEDLGKVNSRSWHKTRVKKNGSYYVKSSLGRTEYGYPGTVLLHRFIMGAIDPKIYVDLRVKVGTFLTIEQAVEEHKKASLQLHGEFSPYFSAN